MTITVHLAVEPEELFDSLITSVLYDIEQATGKKMPAAGLKKGFSYKKVLRAKNGTDRQVTTKITKLQKPFRYAASFKSKQGVNTIDYDIRPCEDGGIDIHYEEEFSSQEAVANASGKLTGALYAWNAKRQIKNRFKQMESYSIQQRENR